MSRRALPGWARIRGARPAVTAFVAMAAVALAGTAVVVYFTAAAALEPPTRLDLSGTGTDPDRVVAGGNPPATPARPGGTGARLRQVDGGAGYYGRFTPRLPTDPSFFPIAVWYESVLQPSDVAKDRDAGLNTYLELTAQSDLGLVRGAGMYAIVSIARPAAGAETVGWLLADEADMWGGPGDAPWTGRYPGEGPICEPADAKCGFTVQRRVRQDYPDDGRLRYSNYGKGVTFWSSDEAARTFVNQFQDVVSVDNYWFTDENICAPSEGGSLFGNRTLPPEHCHRAANYGMTVARVRSLLSPAGSKPVWGFVEVGHPSKEIEWPSITPRQVTAAVWSSIINGARGIVYFNHSFGGPCQTQHALREPCYDQVRAAVRQLNARITALAPVLNAPFADAVTSAVGADVATKWYDGHFYLLAGATQATAAAVSFELRCVGDAVAVVLDEGRSIPVKGGRFTDRFADGNAVHLYRIDGGSSCGAY